MLVGLLACVVASLAFGTIFVPIKKFPASDGFMTQFFMSIGGFFVSFLVHAFLDFPPIYPLAMVGGALWCSANAFAIIIMNRLGMALGILIWSSVSCLTGWATSRYGLFGVPENIPGSTIVNYIGVIILVIGSVFYLFIKSNVGGNTIAEPEKVAPTDQEKGDPPPFKEVQSLEELEMTAPHHHVPIVVRLIALAGAIFSGFFYGSMCTPVTYLQAMDGYPASGLTYLFSFFCGVVPTSTVLLALYSMVKKNVPLMPSELVLPSLLAGSLFGIGMGGFIVGNEQLSQTVAYPICSFAPAVIVSAWSVLYFKEITGKQNFILLGIAYIFTAVGLIMVTVSNSM